MSNLFIVLHDDGSYHSNINFNFTSKFIKLFCENFFYEKIIAYKGYCFFVYPFYNTKVIVLVDNKEDYDEYKKNIENIKMNFY